MLTVGVFQSATELVTFSGDEGLAKADIVQIVRVSGSWYLFYWV